jgi:hypothetical protein
MLSRQNEEQAIDTLNRERERERGTTDIVHLSFEFSLPFRMKVNKEKSKKVSNSSLLS